MRTVVGYIKEFLNNSASSSPYQSVEALTGLPIATGINPGAFQEFSDSEAAGYASKGVNGITILTPGSGQTPGTYTATASTGGAVIQYVVAAGGTVTAIPTVLNPGKYTVDTAPTFTIAAGGTPATVSASLGFLYSGTYQWVQLDPAVVTPIQVGAPLFWLDSASGAVVTTGTIAGAVIDFAGTSIDPNFGAIGANGQINNYAFIQVNGVSKILSSAAITAGAVVGVATSTNTFNATGVLPINAVGIALVNIAVNVTGLARITRAVTEF